MAKQYFRLLSDVTVLYPRDYDLVDPTILDPASASTLFPGEWLKTVYSGSDLKVQRGVGLETDRMCAPYFADFKARTDVQAVKRVPLLQWGEYEAYTFICDTTGMATVGQPLSVNDVTVDSFTGKRGLVLAPVGTTLVLATYVGPGEKTGEIRFLKKPGHTQTI